MQLSDVEKSKEITGNWKIKKYGNNKKTISEEGNTIFFFRQFCIFYQKKKSSYIQ